MNVVEFWRDEFRAAMSRVDELEAQLAEMKRKRHMAELARIDAERKLADLRGRLETSKLIIEGFHQMETELAEMRRTHVKLDGIDVEALALLHDHAAYALAGDAAAMVGLVALSHVIDALDGEDT